MSSDHDYADAYRPPVEVYVAPRPVYQSLQARARLTGRLLVAFAVAAGLNALVDLYDAGVLVRAGRTGLDEATAIAMDDRELVVLVAYALTFIASAISFARLLYTANRNTVPLGRPPQKFSPASMVWWFFVPIFNLFRPMQAVKAVWLASQPEPGEGTPSPILNWWTLWIVGEIVAQVASRAAEKANTPDALATARMLDVASCVVMLAAAFAARTMLRKLAELQDETWLSRQS